MNNENEILLLVRMYEEEGIAYTENKSKEQLKVIEKMVEDGCLEGWANLDMLLKGTYSVGKMGWMK